MKHVSNLSFLALAAIGGGLLFTSSAPATLPTASSSLSASNRAFEGAGQEDEDEETELARMMGKLNGSLRRLRKAIQAEDFASGVRDVSALQRVAIDAKDEVPLTLLDLEAEERQDMLVEYRKEMHGLIRGLLDLEVALLDEDAEEAAKKLRALNGFKKSGHRQFK